MGALYRRILALYETTSYYQLTNLVMFRLQGARWISSSAEVAIVFIRTPSATRISTATTCPTRITAVSILANGPR